ncbi:MAG TPA: F0F1 ATP synthase subunit delta [Thermomicrobiales bacterium]|jgi:F-type H+-transporting ATPase subunit delta|nr:F0F1 ATP synthase subunit delta [Thermomicrobiales bacterium]
MASGAAKRYAQAVFSLAQESNQYDDWERSLSRLNDVMTDERAATYLSDPNISTDDKIGLLDRALADAQPEAHNLIRLLVHRHRLDIIPDMYHLFTEAVLDAKGIAIADVTTADPLSDEEQAVVQRQLSRLIGKDVHLRLTTDPSIIGGIVARVGDQLIDGSVINQLRRLRERLAQPA